MLDNTRMYQATIVCNGFFDTITIRAENIFEAVEKIRRDLEFDELISIKEIHRHTRH